MSEKRVDLGRQLLALSVLIASNTLHPAVLAGFAPCTVQTEIRDIARRIPLRRSFVVFAVHEFFSTFKRAGNMLTFRAT